jgi:hypothetical protein
MNKLTSEQKVWALRWAIRHLEQHSEENNAIEALNHCADIIEKYAWPIVGVDMASGIDGWAVASLLTHNNGIISSGTGRGSDV